MQSPQLTNATKTSTAPVPQALGPLPNATARALPAQTQGPVMQRASQNWPVMTYCAKIADAPYERAQGPDLDKVVVDAQSGTVVAQASTRIGSAVLKGEVRSRMAKAEYVLDPYTPPGQGVPMQATDGSIDSPQETMTADIGHLIKDGQGQLIHVRGCDSDGHWGPLTAQWIVPPKRNIDSQN
ncbi:MAG: hypothetical protein R3C68_03410 [Myxococcota bacterium]